MTLKTLLISSLALLSACAGQEELQVPPEPVIVTEYVYADCGAPPERDFVDLREVKWIVPKNDDDPWLGHFVLTPEGYEDLSFNVSEIWKGVRQLQTEITFYERCVDQKAPISPSD